MTRKYYCKNCGEIDDIIEIYDGKLIEKRHWNPDYFKTTGGSDLSKERSGNIDFEKQSRGNYELTDTTVDDMDSTISCAKCKSKVLHLESITPADHIPMNRIFKDDKYMILKEKTVDNYWIYFYPTQSWAKLYEWDVSYFIFGK